MSSKSKRLAETAAADPPEDAPPSGIPLPIVGSPVQYYCTEGHRDEEMRNGNGPYAAIITSVTDVEHGIVCLRVFPPSHKGGGYDVANVQYGPLGDDNDDGWLMATFY